jgi:dTDP-4-dehydrorhamnose reductase
MDKKKILLTGANGFLASRINKTYSNKYEMIPLTIKDLDITNHELADKILEEVRPNIIIHTAAISATEACENNPEFAYKVNVEASVNIAKKAKEIDAKLLFISSEQVFNGNINEGPYKEDEEPVPNTVYGKTKLEAENLLKKELEELWILRLSWMFGLPERGMPNNSNLFWKLFSALVSDSPIKIASNEYRGITYAYDLIDNLEKVLELPFDTYHFGSVNEKSTYDTAVFMLRKMGVPENRIERIVIRDDERYKDRKRDLRLDYSKIASFGIDIDTSWGSIERAINEFNFSLK